MAHKLLKGCWHITCAQSVFVSTFGTSRPATRALPVLPPRRAPPTPVVSPSTRRGTHLAWGTCRVAGPVRSAKSGQWRGNSGNGAGRATQEHQSVALTSSEQHRCRTATTTPVRGSTLGWDASRGVLHRRRAGYLRPTRGKRTPPCRCEQTAP